MNNVPNQNYQRIPTSNLKIVLRTLAVLALVIGIATFAVLYGQRIMDSVAAQNFSASPQIAGINERLELTNGGKQLFYASNPSVEAPAEFNDQCKTEERTAAILGCYYKNRIHLFDIKDTELDGVLEVTAAHEMLHAAYQRLNIIEKLQVQQMLLKQYEKVKNEKSIKDLMAYYAKAEPTASVDELHSILGTTLINLDPELETYYKRYFKNRSSVVALNTKYNALFNEMNAKADALKLKIDTTEPVITTDLAAYEADRLQLEADIASFNERADGGHFTSQYSFNVARNALIMRSDYLNQRRSVINDRVEAYNADIAEYNKLSVRAMELNKSINGAEQVTGV